MTILTARSGSHFLTFQIFVSITFSSKNLMPIARTRSIQYFGFTFSDGDVPI